MQQGGDRGKSPNVTGTQPKGRKKSTKRTGKKAGEGREGQGSAKSRKPSPKKVAAGTTSKSREK